MPDAHVYNIQIRTYQNGELVWGTFQVQMEVDQIVEFEWRQKVMTAFPAALFVKPFQWSAESVILIDIKLSGHLARAVFDHGSSGVSISQAWDN